MSPDTLPLPEPAPSTNDKPKRQPPAPSTIPPALYTVADVAALLQVCRRAIERMDAAGKLPGSIKLGKSRRFRREAIDNWIAAGCPRIEPAKRRAR